MPRPRFSPAPDASHSFDENADRETENSDIEYSKRTPSRADIETSDQNDDLPAVASRQGGAAPRSRNTRVFERDEEDFAPPFVAPSFDENEGRADYTRWANARRPSLLGQDADATRHNPMNNFHDENNVPANRRATNGHNANRREANRRETKRDSNLRDAARRASAASPTSNFDDHKASQRDASQREISPRATSQRAVSGRDISARDAASARQSATFSAADSNGRNSSTRSTRASSSGDSRDRAAKERFSDDKNGARSSPPRSSPPRALWYEVGGVLSLALGAMLGWNVHLSSTQVRGALPRLSLEILRVLFGIGTVVVPLLLVALGALMIARHHRTNLRAFWRGATVAFAVLLTGVHLIVPHGSEFGDSATLASHGGIVGGALSWALRSLVGTVGAVIFLVALSVVALLLWSELSLAQTLRRARDFGRGIAQTLRFKRPRRFLEPETNDDWHDTQATESEILPRSVSRRALRAANADIEYSIDEKTARVSPFLPVDELLQDAPNETPPIEPKVAEIAPDLTPKIEFTDAPPPVSVLEAPPELAVSADSMANRVLDSVGISPAIKNEDEMTPTEKLEAQALATATEGEASSRAPRVEKPRRRFGDGPLMPEYFDDAVRALDPPVVPDLEGAEDDIHAGVKAVTETLASFKIDARVTDVKRGPVITRYEVQPAPGVRVATIAALDRDMSRALSAIAVRIEAPVPGKDVIGIEVPNKKVNLVRLRDVLERHEFLSTQSKLSFVLGKDIAGQPKWADLTKMPHMLVAGATNSGKSVCLNSIIASILVRATPEEVKFSLIDPKRVELTLFNGIKHLYHPVVVEPKDAVKVLRGMIAEMDRRYKAFAERGVRNIVSYNSKLEPDEAPLPYIVIVIDELADLMMTAAAEFEKLICRLAQLARATGIHLIVATQRPSVNVITGVIKANIPSRIAFAVASQVDSRTILDSMGAERLIGSGDMLFDANNGGKAIRIQGAYLSEEEVNRVVDVVKAAYADDETPMEYGMDISAVTEDDVNEANEKTVARSEKKDELYGEILEYVVRNTEMSASMIQRKFEIGYPRAARIVDQFERDGVLSPANGSKPRKVIGNGRGVEMN